MGPGPLPWTTSSLHFHGKVHLIQIDGSRFTHHRCALYDRHWQDTGARVQLERFDGPVREPPNLELMLQTAETLGADLDFVRVDLYDVGNRIYFGEMTSTPGGGFALFRPASHGRAPGPAVGRSDPSVQRFREPGVAGFVFDDFADAGEREVLGVEALAGGGGLGDERYPAGGAGGLVGVERDVPLRFAHRHDVAVQRVAEDQQGVGAGADAIGGMARGMSLDWNRVDDAGQKCERPARTAPLSDGSPRRGRLRRESRSSWRSRDSSRSTTSIQGRTCEWLRWETRARRRVSRGRRCDHHARGR